MPHATYIDSWCIVNGKVYISTSDYENPGLLEYNPDTDTWVTLSTPTQGYGMVCLNGKLTLVGGRTSESTSYYPIIGTSKIQVWDMDSKQWIEPYPPMTIERAKVKCASYLHYLIIADGKVNFDEVTISIELLDTKSGQWYKAPSMPLYEASILPFIGIDIQSMIMIGGILCISYFRRTIGDLTPLLPDSKYKPCTVSLPTLISHTLQGKHHDTSIWEKIPEVPYKHTTLFSIGNMLLTAGGDCGGIFTYKPSADIHLFNPHMNKWLKVGELPEPRSSCACTVLPSGKLLVAGQDKSGVLNTIYTATIAGSYFEPGHF
jgi:hypothetical protein